MHKQTLLKILLSSIMLHGSSYVLAENNPLSLQETLDQKHLFTPYENCSQDEVDTATIHAIGLSCYTFQTPKDHSRESIEDDSVDMFFSIRPADDQEHKKGVLFFNFGGPGSSAADVLINWLTSDSLDSLPQVILNRFDLVALDPRGTGRSAFSDDLITCTHPDSAISHTKENGLTCDLTQLEYASLMGTHTLVQDTERLRLLLDQGKMNYIGFSYGTRVGALYATKYPSQTRAVVLNSPMKASSNTLSDLYEGTSEALLKHMGYVIAKNKLAEVPGFSFLNDLDKVVPNSDNNPISEYALYGNLPIARITNPSEVHDIITIKGIENDLVVYDVNEFHDLRISKEILFQVMTAYLDEIYYSILINKTLDSTEKFRQINYFFRLSTQADKNLAREFVAWFQQEDKIKYFVDLRKEHAILSAVFCTDQDSTEQLHDRQIKAFKSQWNLSFASSDNFCSAWQPNMRLDRGPKLGHAQHSMMIIGNEFDPVTPKSWYTDMKLTFPNAYHILIQGNIEHGGLFSQPINQPSVSIPLNDYVTDFLLHIDDNESGSLATKQGRLSAGQEVFLTYTLPSEIDSADTFYANQGKLWLAEIMRAKTILADQD